MKKRTMIAGFVLAATLTFSMPVSNLDGSLGVDVVSAASGSTSTPKPAPAKSPSKSSSSKSSSSKSSSVSSVLKLGSRGTAVKSLQTSLNKNGAKLTVDGIFGSKTVAAVKSYQSKNGLASDGIVGPMTSARLNPVTVKLGSVGAQVKLLQMDLNKAGAKLTVDGVFGKKTLAAVKSFQTKNGLKADGIVGPLTHSKLKVKPATTKPDTVSAASTNVSSIEVFRKSISKDGKWIIATSKNLTSATELVLDGTFTHNGTVERNIALYNQDAKGNITARYILTAPKLTIKSPNARISNGTFKGDIYVAASNFKLVGTKVEGNVYFANDTVKNTFKMDDKSSITGKGATDPSKEPDDTTGASEVPDDNTPPPVDDVTAASVVNEVKAFEKSIGTAGYWIVATTKDLVSTNNLVLDGDYENGKTNTDGTKQIQRKIALYTQDDAHKVTGEFTLTAPKITIKSANARIQNGTFVGDIYVERDNFLLAGTTVKGNVYVNQPNFTLSGDAKIEGNVIFATQALKDAFVPPTGTTITGEQKVATPDVVTTASVVDNAGDFEKAIGTDGTWIIATLKDLVSTNNLVLAGTYENGKTNTDGTKQIQRKIALYTQDDAHKVTGEFTLTAPKLTVTSPNARIQNGTFIGDLYVDSADFLLSGTTVKGNVYISQPGFNFGGDARVEGNVYFTTQDAKDKFNLINPAVGTVTGAQILTQLESPPDVVTTASLVRTDSALETAIGTGGNWIAGILNDITTTKNLVIDGEKYKGTATTTSRKLALYSQAKVNGVNVKTRDFTLTAPTLTVNSSNANLTNGIFKGDIYVTATGFKLVGTKVEGNLYFATQELLDAYLVNTASTGTVSGTIGVKTK